MENLTAYQARQLVNDVFEDEIIEIIIAIKKIAKAGGSSLYSIEPLNHSTIVELENLGYIVKRPTGLRKLFNREILIKW